MATPTKLVAIDEIAPLVEASKQQPVLFFKHSLTCPVSDSAFREYLAFLADRSDDAAYTLIEIQNARPVSNHVAEATGVRHESPQAILLRDGKPVWHASHWKITRQALAAALAS
jgi:bacillithiol system protein YtxJ